MKLLPFTRRDWWYALAIFGTLGVGIAVGVLVAPHDVALQQTLFFAVGLVSVPAMAVSGVLLSWFVPHELPPRRD